MPVATVSTGVDIFYEPFGDTADPVLLLMHGLGSQLLLWEEAVCNALVAK